MMMPDDIKAMKFSLTNQKWQYRGEGNSSIVVSLPLEKKVLRLPKCDVGVDTNPSKEWQRLCVNTSFIATIMKPLLGPMFVSLPSLVQLSESDVEMLNKQLSSVRPENRRHKMLMFCGAELCDDHAFLPQELSVLCLPKSVCIELKPKQGIIAPSERHYRHCIFCRKQALKLKDGQVFSRSLYCPLDLFSGCQSRMKQAIKSLCHSPQNNLRIFCDGDLVYGEEHSESHLEKVLSTWLHPVPGSDLLERFISLVLQALKREFTSDRCNDLQGAWRYDGAPHHNKEQDIGQHNLEETQKCLTWPPCNFEQHALPQDCILQRLAQGQALDNIGVASVKDILLCQEGFHEEIKQDDLKCTNTENYEYVHNVIRKGCSSKLNPIESYLIAAAVRDCSVLITFQEMAQSDKTGRDTVPQVQDELSKICYVFKISVVDIGPKPLSCILSHVDKQVSLWKAYAEVK